MYRIRLCLSKNGPLAQYHYQDLIHDALINAWCAAGAKPEEVIGAQAKPWVFAPLGFHRAAGNSLHTLVVSTPDPLLSSYLQRLDPQRIRKVRVITAEAIDLAAAMPVPEPDPIAPQQGRLQVLLLSPLAIRLPDTHRWATDFTSLDLTAAINSRLSRLAGRPVQLTVTPDALYLRANPSHTVMVPVKRMANGQRSFVIGLTAPLTLEGNDADLTLAWYAGLGEKNRNGFGCIGHVEQGIGR